MRKLAIALALCCALTLGFTAGRASADQPHMQAAKADLNAALDDLRQADSNKGGHKERAMGLINQALIEVQLGIDFAR
jgi:hypothetical protein